MRKEARRCLLVSIAVVVTLSMLGAAGVPAGYDAASFARQGVDPRPLAMGGAFVGVSTGAPIAYYNPAGLVRAEGWGAGSLYSEPFGPELGIAFQTFSGHGAFQLQTPSLRLVGVGASWIMMEIREIPIWSEDSPDVEYFTARSSLYSVSVALTLSDSIAAGVSAKLYRESILEGTGSGVGLDVGFQWTVSIGEIPVTLGINAMDVGRTKIQWTGTAGEPENYVSWVNKLGASVRLLDGLALVAADFDWAVGRPARDQVVHLGVEVVPISALAIRGGLRADLEGDVRPSAGVGLHLFGLLDVDYAFVLGTPVGAAHYVSLRLLL